MLSLPVCHCLSVCVNVMNDLAFDPFCSVCLSVCLSVCVNVMNDLAFHPHRWSTEAIGIRLCVKLPWDTSVPCTCSIGNTSFAKRKHTKGCLFVCFLKNAFFLSFCERECHLLLLSCRPRPQGFVSQLL